MTQLIQTGGGSSGGGGVTSWSGDGVLHNNSGSTGSVTESLISIAANLVLAGPASGSNAPPTFRGLVAADAPNYCSSQAGYFWGGFVCTPISTPISTTMSTTVRAIQFVLPFAITVAKITANLVTGVAAGVTSFGIYNSAGTLLIDSGQITTTVAAQGVVQATITPVALPPGVYYFGFISNSTTTAFSGTTGLNNTTTGGILNKTLVRMGHSANGYSGVNMPSSLGSLTSDSGDPIPYVLFES
jgi:hypothetical protein